MQSKGNLDSFVLMKILTKKILLRQSQNYKKPNKNQSEKMINKKKKMVTLNYVLFLKMKIYLVPLSLMDQSCDSKTRYLVKMVKWRVAGVVTFSNKLLPFACKFEICYFCCDATKSCCYFT